MNDTGEMWSLPWHTLQRDLARGLDGHAPAHAGAVIKAVAVQSSMSAGSWMGRARLRVPTPPQEHS